MKNLPAASSADDVWGRDGAHWTIQESRFREVSDRDQAEGDPG